MDKDQLKRAIRTVPDFPKPGILFYDITSILASPEAFHYCINRGADFITTQQVDKIVAIDARGFLFAAPIAYKLSLPLTIVRKNKKLPGPTLSKSFTLEYGEERVEVQIHDIANNDNIVIVDDLIATGGTLRAVAELLTDAGGRVQSFFAIIGLAFLNYNKVLHDYKVHTVLDYD